MTKSFQNAKPKMEKVFANPNYKQSLKIKIKNFDTKTDNPENKNIKMFCKFKLQTGKKVFTKMGEQF